MPWDNGGPSKSMVELISTSYYVLIDTTPREHSLVISHPKLTIVQKESSDIELDFANLSFEVVSQLVGWFDELANEINSSRRPISILDNEDLQTTNPYIKSLVRQVDENCLSLTLDWPSPNAINRMRQPRMEEERIRQWNISFIVFMTKADGKAAEDEMQEFS